MKKQSPNYRYRVTDIELCIELAPEAGDDYRLALDVMTAYPDYAKTKFRIVVECLTLMLANEFNVDLRNLDLHGSINELCESQVIDCSLRGDLHEIRKLGNEVVHSKPVKGLSVDDVKDAKKVRGAGDLESAIAARKLLIGIFESIFLLINKGKTLPIVALVEIGDITSQQTLWRGISTMDFEAKMAAGLILEAHSLAPLPQGEMVITRREYTHNKTTENMAAELYWAACVISADVGRFSVMEIEKRGGEDACLFKYANTEALFRYSQLTFDQSVSEGSQHQQRGGKALEVAAQRGHAAACASYGDFLRQKGELDKAFKFLSNALSYGDISGYAALALLYLERTYSNYSKKLAEQYLMDGITSGSSHCKYLLGRLLYEGKQLEQDKERGKELLKAASDAGYKMASHYLALAVDDRLAKQMQEYFSRIQYELEMELLNISTVPKQGRNESCHCGSGKKYKKCCFILRS